MTNATSTYELAAILTFASELAQRKELTLEHIQEAEKLLNEPQEGSWTPKEVVQFLKTHKLEINYLDFRNLQKSTKSLTLHLDPANPKPQVWKELMTKKLYLPFLVQGTRQITGEGSTDGLLLPEYAKLRDEVNKLREQAGLGRVGW